MRIQIRNNIYVQLTKGNLRGFTLETNSEDIVIRRDEQYYITTVLIEDKYRIKLGDVIDVDGITYTVNKIRQSSNTFFCVQEKATKTSQFIMPVLGEDYAHFDFENSFYNSYLSDDYHSIYLVYKFTNSEKYLKLEEKLQTHPYFEEIIDPNPELVVIKLGINPMFWKDIEKVMKGKYTEISTTLKAKICIFHGFSTKSKVYRMLYRDKTLREEMSQEYGFEIGEEYELMSKPILEEELWSKTSISKSKQLIEHD